MSNVAAIYIIAQKAAQNVTTGLRVRPQGESHDALGQSIVLALPESLDRFCDRDFPPEDTARTKAA